MENLIDVFGSDLTDFFELSEYGNFNPVYNLEHNTDNIYYCSRYLCYGDYDNSCHVERSNYRVFLQMFPNHPDILKKSYHYSAEYIYIKATCVDPEIIEVLTALCDYPAIDDQDCSLMEHEIFNECYGSYIKQDFIDKILKDNDLLDIDYDEDNLLDYLTSLMNKHNIYFEVQAGGSGYLDLHRLDVSDLPDTINPVYYTE